MSDHPSTFGTRPHATDVLAGTENQPQPNANTAIADRYPGRILRRGHKRISSRNTVALPTADNAPAIDGQPVAKNRRKPCRLPKN